MPETRKHNDGDHPTLPLPTEFPSFNRLPPEIATRIITLACRSPEKSSKKEDIKKRSRLALDVQTTLSLTLVSKSVGKVATSTLYETIRIAKPSALLELHATLDTRPELAKRIRNLSVGSEETLPTSEWPLAMEFARGDAPQAILLLRSTVFLTAGDLPGWAKRAHRWLVEPSGVSVVPSDKDEQSAAIIRAVRSAVDHVDVDPYKREYSKSGKKIGLVSDSKGDDEAVRTFTVTDALATPPTSFPTRLLHRSSGQREPSSCKLALTCTLRRCAASTKPARPTSPIVARRPQQAFSTQNWPSQAFHPTQAAPPSISSQAPSS